MKIGLSEYEEGVADGREESEEIIRQQQASLVSDVEVIERLYKEIQIKDEAIFNSEKQAYNLAMQVQNQQTRIEQLEKTQDYLYKTHDADKAEIEALKARCAQLKEDNDGFARQMIAHPVKELTDEEIKQIFVEESGFDVDTCPIAIMDFARAILRKANEK